MSKMLSYDSGNYAEERVGWPEDLTKRLADMEARLARLEKLVEVTP